VIGNAVKVMRIATGQEPEDYGPDDGRNKAAQALGSLGGKARGQTHIGHPKAAKPRWKGR
jgi:hypothetical protein